MKKDTRSNAVIVAVIVLLLAVVGLAGGTCATAFWISSEVGRALGPQIGSGSKVGILRIEGVITSGRAPAGGSSGTVYSEQMASLIDQADQNQSIKAIVLRIDSPGGSVVGSNEIYQALQKVKKPIVISMGEMAASGGYYVSCAADKIMANPATLTGSIGVIAQMPDISGLMDKLGLDVTVIKSGKFKDEGSPFRPMTPEEKRIWQDIIDEAYGQFVGIVAEGRSLPVEKVRELADGRVYTGQQAIDLGLADEEGNLPDAIKLAAEMGGIKGEPRTVELFTPPTFMQTLLASLPQSSISVNVPGLPNVSNRPVLQYLYVSP